MKKIKNIKNIKFFKFLYLPISLFFLRAILTIFWYFRFLLLVNHPVIYFFSSPVYFAKLAFTSLVRYGLSMLSRNHFCRIFVCYGLNFFIFSNFESFGSSMSSVWSKPWVFSMFWCAFCWIPQKFLFFPAIDYFWLVSFNAFGGLPTLFLFSIWPGFVGSLIILIDYD